jgi:hypothetical protein
MTNKLLLTSMRRISAINSRMLQKHQKIKWELTSSILPQGFGNLYKSQEIHWKYWVCFCSAHFVTIFSRPTARSAEGLLQVDCVYVCVYVSCPTNRGLWLVNAVHEGYLTWPEFSKPVLQYRLGSVWRLCTKVYTFVIVAWLTTNWFW